VWRRGAAELEVLLVHRPRYRDWSWPKGKAKPGERAAVCAVRETVEETGRQVVLGVPLPPVCYTLKSGRVKRVEYWAARVASDLDNPAICARPTIRIARPAEIDKTGWFPLSKARARLTRASDTAPLDALAAWDRAGALDTRAVLLLRHARAVKRSAWSGDEASRPLTRDGWARARGLVPLLSAFGVDHVVSSPWARCRRTVAPYARRGRVTLHTNQWLSEAGAAESPERAARLLAEALVGGGEATGIVLCAHRPVLPGLCEVLSGALWTAPGAGGPAAPGIGVPAGFGSARGLGPGAAAAGPDAGLGATAGRGDGSGAGAGAPWPLANAGELTQIPSEDPYLRTAEFLVAHVAMGSGALRPGRIVAVGRHRPAAA
jgi:8-oxo-dGTP diphosphatase